MAAMSFLSCIAKGGRCSLRTPSVGFIFMFLSSCLGLFFVNVRSFVRSYTLHVSARRGGTLGLIG